MSAIRRLLALGLLALTCSAVNAQSLDQGMQNMFASQANVTQPGYVKGQARNVITGGSVQVRNRIMNAQLVSFEPPHISAGCGGIDATFGSLSVVSSQEFIQLARSVASNAAGYAFQLALSSMCQQCMTQIESLRKTMDQINQANVNSCQLAERMVDASGFTKAMADLKAAQSRTEAGTGGSDYTANLNQGPGKDAPVSDLAKEDPEAARKIIRNYVWDALANQNVGAWFDTSTSQELREEMMSVIGTVVVCTSGDAECPDTGDGTRKGDPVVRPWGATLRLAEAVAGSSSDSGEVQILRCADSDRCLKVEQKAASGYKGMRQMVLDAMLGSEGERDTGGLIGLYVHNSTATLTATQKALQTSRGDYVTMALNLAALEGGEPLARSFVAKFADVIAAELAYDNLIQMIDGMDNLVSVDGDPSGRVHANLVAARKNLVDDYNTLMAQTSNRQVLIQAYTNLLNQAGNRTVQVPTGGMVTR